MRKNSYLGSIISFSIFLLLLWNDREFLFDNACFAQKNFAAEHWHGVVTRKFIDTDNHSLPSLTIRDAKGDSLIEDFSSMEHIYDEIYLGDTILKHQGSNDVLQCHNQCEQLIGTADFGCND